MKIVPNALYQSDCLALLERLEIGTVDLIYLDPPRNTHNLFTGGKSKDYKDFLSNVIQISKQVLSDSGSILYHTEPALTSITRLILDQIFGVRNFRAEFIWPNRRMARQPAKPGGHDVIWFYSKSDNFTYHPPARPLSRSEVKRFYPNTSPLGAYKLLDLILPRQRPQFQFQWRGFSPPTGYSWRFSIETLNSLDAEGRIEYTSKRGLPKQRVFLSDTALMEIGSIWDDIFPIIPPNENYKFPGQKPIALLNRIISIASNSDDLVVDPLCGSGTTLVAAHALGREWIGGDNSPEAIVLSTERLKESLNLHPDSDFFIGDQTLIEKIPRYPIHYISLFRNTEASDMDEIVSHSVRERPVGWNYFGGYRAEIQTKIRPLIITEGKTDWKHLEAALRALQAAGNFTELKVTFLEYEDDMGDESLLKMCSYYARIPQERLIIFVFDRDKHKIVEKVTEGGLDFRYWQNNVYSLALPVPAHRRRTPAVCIELYYKDRDLKRKDREGRRLFLSSEFSRSSGWHKEENLTSTHKAFRHDSLSIIDGDVYDRNDEDVALSKSRFANNILNQDDCFKDIDFRSFSRFFQAICEIVKDTEKKYRYRL